MIAVVASSGIVLVIGGVGYQGSAVVRWLREHGSPVRVLTDEPKSGAAQALRQLGAEIVHGSLDDRASLDQALTGIDALFTVLDQTDTGPSGDCSAQRPLATRPSRQKSGTSSTRQARALTTT